MRNANVRDLVLLGYLTTWPPGKIGCALHHSLVTGKISGRFCECTLLCNKNTSQSRACRCHGGAHELMRPAGDSRCQTTELIIGESLSENHHEALWTNEHLKSFGQLNVEDHRAKIFLLRLLVPGYGFRVATWTKWKAWK